MTNKCLDICLPIFGPCSVPMVQADPHWGPWPEARALAARVFFAHAEDGPMEVP